MEYSTIKQNVMEKLKKETKRENKVKLYKDLIYLTVPSYINSDDSYIRKLMRSDEIELCKFYHDLTTYSYLVKLTDYDFLEHILPAGSTEWLDAIRECLKSIHNFKDNKWKIFNSTVDIMAGWLEDEYYNGKNILNYYSYAHRAESPEEDARWQGEGFFIPMPET